MRLLETPDRNYAKHPQYVYEGETTREVVTAISHISNRKPFHPINDFVIFIFWQIYHIKI